MKLQSIKTIVVIFLLTFVLSCSSSSTDTPSDTTTTADLTNAGAMVASAFSSTGSASMSAQPSSLAMTLIKLIVAEAKAQQQQGDTNSCDDASTGGGPANVTTAATGAAGTYGSATDSVTVTEASFCEDSDGNSNGDNADDLLFGTFDVSRATVTCDDDSTATMSGSGIWRNRDDLGFFPEIFGSFRITIGGVSGTANCSIALNGNQSVADASCTNEDGTAVTLTESVSCTIDAGEES